MKGSVVYVSIVEKQDSWVEFMGRQVSTPFGEGLGGSWDQGHWWGFLREFCRNCRNQLDMGR